MAYDNNITPGYPPLLWSDVNKAFQQINENFTIIGSAIARTSPVNIAHIELSNPVRVVNTENHTYTTAQQVTITQTGITQLDNNTYYIKVVSDNEFTLYSDESLTSSINGTGYDAYSSGGGQSQGIADFAGIDFTRMHTSINPAATATYSLGDNLHRWAQLHLGEWTDAPGFENNGLWLGSAQVKGLGSTVDLPPLSTVDGVLIIDPDKTFFKEVQVDNDQVIVASDFVDSLNLISGNAIQMVVDSGAESITINNTGVRQLNSGSGISVSSGTGIVTVSNTGVINVTNSTSLPVSATGRTLGAGISTSSSTGGITLTNTGVISVSAGTGITVSSDPASGDVTITNAAPAQVAFRNIYVDGTNPATDTIVADSTADTLTLVEGYGIILSPVPATDTLEIILDQNIDIIGSVFADDSSIMVDAVDNQLHANKVNTPVIEGSSVQINSLAGITITASTTGSIQTNNNLNISSLTGNVILTGSQIELDSPVTAVLGITGDLTGSVFADDSTLMVDAVDNKLNASELDITGYGNAFQVYDGGFNWVTSGNLNLVVGGIGGINSTGNFTINSSSGDVFLTSTGSIGFSDGTTQITAWTGAGDLTGSVFADDSTILVDAIDGKIVGPINCGSTAKFNVTNVPANSTGASGDEAGMIAFDSTSVYYCIADWAAPGSANIWVKQDWSTTGAW